MFSQLTDTIDEIHRNKVTAILHDAQADITADCAVFPQFGFCRIVVPLEAFRRWRAGGVAIQDAFPDLAPHWRETLKTGTTPAEWVRNFEGRDIDPDEAEKFSSGEGICFGCYVFEVD